jgi:hypothetical protein
MISTSNQTGVHSTDSTFAEAIEAVDPVYAAHSRLPSEVATISGSTANDVQLAVNPQMSPHSSVDLAMAVPFAVPPTIATFTAPLGATPFLHSQYFPFLASNLRYEESRT